MAQNIINKCPICSHELIATKLYCRHCGLELSNEFILNKFLALNERDLYFVETFLKCSGNLKEVKEQLNLSYPSAKKQWKEIQFKLGYTHDPVRDQLEVILKELPVYEDDSPIIKAIKEKLNHLNGTATLTLPRGNHFTVKYEEYGTGLYASNLPEKYIVTWQAIDKAIELLTLKGGRALKGNAMKAKLGESGLTLDTIEGYIAYHAYHIKKGDSVIRSISAVSAILEWSGMVKNGYGYLELISDGLLADLP